MPQRLGIGSAAVQLEAVLAGVAGARHEALHPRDLALGKVIVRDHRHAEARELTDQRFGLWSLHRQQRGLVRDVAQPDVGAGLLRDDVVPILLNVRRVHDHHQLVFEAIDETVVDERAVFGENAGVLCLSRLQGADVVARHALHERVAVRARDLELAHVRHVEHADILPHGFVLGGNSVGIADRHLEAGEGHHLGAQRDVHVVQRCLLQSFSSH